MKKQAKKTQVKAVKADEKAARAKELKRARDARYRAAKKAKAQAKTEKPCKSAKDGKTVGKTTHAIGIGITIPAEVKTLMNAFIDAVVPLFLSAVADTVSEAFRIGTEAKCKCAKKKAGK